MSGGSKTRLGVNNVDTSALPGGLVVSLVSESGTDRRQFATHTVSVGRSEDCALTIPHETLSRRHLTITLRDSVCFIEDHASSNGTFVNGRRIPARQSIRVLPNDKIVLGQADITMTVASSASATVKPEVAAPPAFNNQDAELKASEIISSARREADQIVSAARVQADSVILLAKQRESQAQTRALEITTEAEISAEDVLARARQRAQDVRVQAETVLEETRRKTESEAKFAREALAAELEAQVTKAHVARAEITRLEEVRSRAQALAGEEEAERQLRLAQITAYAGESETAKRGLISFNRELAEVRSQIESATKERDELEKATQTAREQLAAERRSLESQTVVSRPPAVVVEEVVSKPALIARPIISPTVTLAEIVAFETVSPEDAPAEETSESETSEPVQARGRWPMAVGLCLSLIVVGLGESAYREVQSSSATSGETTMSSKATVRPATYVDNIVDNASFAKDFNETGFRQDLENRVRPYLAKEFGTENDRALEAIEASAEVVRKLGSLRKIPRSDRLPINLSKMREVEVDADIQLLEILGSEAAVASFKKFTIETWNAPAGKPAKDVPQTPSNATPGDQ